MSSAEPVSSLPVSLSSEAAAAGSNTSTTVVSPTSNASPTPRARPSSSWPAIERPTTPDAPFSFSLTADPRLLNHDDSSSKKRAQQKHDADLWTLTGPTSTTPSTAGARMSVCLLLSHKTAGMIIGVGGANIAHLRARSGAKMEVNQVSVEERIAYAQYMQAEAAAEATTTDTADTANASQRLLIATGTQQQVQHALEAVIDQVAEKNATIHTRAIQSQPLQPDSAISRADLRDKATLTFIVPTAQLGAVMGKKGRTLQATRSITSAVVRVGEKKLPHNDGQCVLIAGTRHAAKEAMKLIVQQLASAQSHGKKSDSRPPLLQSALTTNSATLDQVASSRLNAAEQQTAAAAPVVSLSTQPSYFQPQYAVPLPHYVDPLHAQLQEASLELQRLAVQSNQQAQRGVNSAELHATRMRFDEVQRLLAHLQMQVVVKEQYDRPQFMPTPLMQPQPVIVSQLSPYAAPFVASQSPPSHTFSLSSPSVSHAPAYALTAGGDEFKLDDAESTGDEPHLPVPSTRRHEQPRERYALPLHLHIPSAQVGWLIGPKGEHINRVRKDSGAFVQINPARANQRIIKFGRPTNEAPLANNADAAMSSLDISSADDDERKQSEVEQAAASASSSPPARPGGRRRQLPADPETHVVTISGSAEQIERASQILALLMEAQKLQVVPTRHITVSGRMK